MGSWTDLLLHLHCVPSPQDWDEGSEIVFFSYSPPPGIHPPPPPTPLPGSRFQAVFSVVFESISSQF